MMRGVDKWADATPASAAATAIYDVAGAGMTMLPSDDAVASTAHVWRAAAGGCAPRSLRCEPMQGEGAPQPRRRAVRAQGAGLQPGKLGSCEITQSGLTLLLRDKSPIDDIYLSISKVWLGA